MTHYLRRPARWLRRTRWMAARIAEDFGLRGATRDGPAWLRGNPFLGKAARTETRRFSVGLRLLVAVGILSGLLLGGLWLHGAYPRQLAQVLTFTLGAPFPTALFVVLSFFHAVLISNARTALTVSPTEEARRGTLPDLLLTPLRRAEMLVAMGVGPARTAFLVALAGLPLYALLAEFGGLTWGEIGLLYVLFALLSYVPPTYALPTPTAGAGPALVTQAAPNARARRRQASGGGPLSGAWLWPLLSVFFFGRMLSLVGLFTGGWLGHLGAALHVTLGPAGRMLFFFAWPYLLVQSWGRPLQVFHLPLPPLLLVVPFVVLNWAAGALGSAAALSAGDAGELRASAAFSRAQTLARWVARAAGLAALGVVWAPWVESGDFAGLAGSVGGGAGWDAAGLMLALGAACLPNVCRRALEASQAGQTSRPRPPLLVLRRAIKRASRPLLVAIVTFGLACALGGLSPFAPPFYTVVGRVALAAGVTVLWAIGLARLLPVPKRRAVGSAWSSPTFVHFAILYGLPVALLASPLSWTWPLAALSPASAWVRLFPGGAEAIQRFPLYHLGLLPPFPVCVAGAGVVGLALMVVGLGLMVVGTRVRPPAGQEGPLPARSSPPSPVRGGPGLGRKDPARNEALTAMLMGWVTARTDNPLFTYEMRTRTRSGKWADWRYMAPGVFFGVVVLGLAYPDVLAGLTFVSPFHFFGLGSLSLGAGRTWVWSNLASLLLAAQVYVFGLRGQTVGETLIARDRQRGIWGFILLSPLSARQIFQGKVFGQTFGFGGAWAVLGTCEFILYALAFAIASPMVSLGPALVAWLVGQTFVAALFLLGVGLGAALATFPIFLKSLRGASTLLLVGLIGGGIWLNLHVLPLGGENTWEMMATRLALGSAYAFVLAIPLLAFGEWRVGALRRKDVPFGDGVEE